VSAEPIPAPSGASAQAADETIRRLRAAGEAGDVDGVLELVAPDVVLRSPITASFEFRGREELRELLEAVFATIEDIRYHDELGDSRSRALFYRARVGSQPLEEAALVRLDEQARITELTLWFRPLRGLTKLTAGLAPRLAARNGRVSAVLATGASGLLHLLTVAGEGPLLRLVRQRRRR
jgi:hypothetical protein